MVTNRVFTRTYWIKCGGNHGTGFLVDLDSRRYLITAKHVVEDYSSETPIYYSKKYKWTYLPTEVTWLGNDLIDLAIFSPKIPTRPNQNGWNIELNSANVQIGQDVFYCGFPYSMYTDTLGSNDGFPLGLVKKACMSGIDSKKDIYFLDGIVNQGFSGAPVVAKVQEEEQEKIIAVIQGYYGKKSQVIQDGKETELEVEYNSGIIRSFNIRIITDQIKLNPNGFELEW